MSDNESDATRTIRQILDVPRITASSFFGQSTGNEMLILCNSAFPVVDPNTSVVTDGPVVVTTAVLALSPGAAKDLATLLNQFIENHEQQVGPIRTPYGKATGSDAPEELLLMSRSGMSRA